MFKSCYACFLEFISLCDPLSYNQLLALTKSIIYFHLLSLCTSCLFLYWWKFFCFSPFFYLNALTTLNLAIFFSPKKGVLFPGIGRAKNFLITYPPTYSNVYQNIFCLMKKTNTRKQKAKEAKEEKRISIENLTGCYDIACEFALCTFNLRDRVVNFSYEFNVVHVQRKKSQGLLYDNNI